MTISALREIAIGVADLDKRTAFYRDIFGLTVIRESTISSDIARALYGLADPIPSRTLARTDVPSSVRIRLMRLEGEEGRPSRDLRWPGPVGIGFTTASIQPVFERVAGAGVQFISPPVKLTPGSGPDDPFRFEAFGRAEDGEYIVLIERGNTPVPYGDISAASGVSQPLHTSHAVLDLAACNRFLHDVLGHEVLVHEHCEGPLFEELMGLPPGQRFDFDMLWDPGFSTGRIVLMEFEGIVADPASVHPPTRGICALRYDTSDLTALLPRIEPAGGRILRGPVTVDDPALGRGQVVAVMSPIGTLFEIWEPDLSDNPTGEFGTR
ncbi:MAG: hypothetical protein KatS3mg060_0021 [Dehalococcoidia bacterium]|nr:MAG: hypothetical protein KatS3mg060_0021 [Dehalococcoidia bacterium]